MNVNLGCGRDIRPGFVNVDVARLPGVDVVHDLNEMPLPFGDDSADLVMCKDVLEHVQWIPLLRDIHRFLKPGGVVHIEAVHFTSRARWVDPTHTSAFSIDTFEFFVRDGTFDEFSFYFDFAFSEVRERRISFEHRRALPWNRRVQRFVNGDRRRQELYEASGLSRLFPAENVVVELVK